MIPFPKKKEFDYIQSLAQNSSPEILLGIGDDAAVIASRSQPLVVAHDLMSEGIHFKQEWSRPEDLADKLLKSNLSDFEAMGAKAEFALCSFAFSQSWKNQYIHEFLVNFRIACDQYEIKIVGGDTSSALGNSTLGLTLMGYPLGNILKRNAAKIGQSLFVSGFLGLSKAGLYCLENNLAGFDSLIKQHLNPDFHLGLGGFLAKQNGVGAVMDLSDDLYSSLEHLCLQSKCGFQLAVDETFIHPDLNQFIQQVRGNPYEYILFGGEEYKLLFTADRNELWVNELIAQRKIHSIGHVIEENEISLPQGIEFQNLKKCDFQHFHEAQD